MIYAAYQAHYDLTNPMRVFAQWMGLRFNALPTGYSDNVLVRRLSAMYELIAFSALTHTRPSFGIKTVKIDKKELPVTEETVLTAPFGTLLHFKKDIRAEQPRVLVVAPLSGHFSTLLRGTVETLLPDHDVYITDWHNARDVNVSHGEFGFDDFIAYVIRFLEAIGPGAHVIAVCQPCVQVLAAVAIMSEAGNTAQPRSMTLMAGPVDARVNPTKVNELATGRSIDWFERNLIAAVPSRYQGAARRVYPGFVQLSAFMSMSIERHVQAHLDLYESLVKGDHEKVQLAKVFYNEYFAVLDLTAEFYLETVQKVFQEHELGKGVLEWQGRRIDPRAIKRTALLTIEGERDEICSLGQTVAAHDLCGGLRPYKKRHHMQAGVGHYGVFSGTRWKTQIYPILKNTILASD